MAIEEHHEMRLDCAKNFGELKSELRHVAETRTEDKERRREDWNELKEIKRELHKLVGNGNRGRIDEMAAEFSSLKAEVKSREDVICNDIKHLSSRFDALENKFWWIVVKVIAPLFVGVSILNFIAQYFVDKIG